MKSGFVEVKKVGPYLKGKCILKDSDCKKKSPFAVSTERNIYYCFECHQGGSILELFKKGI